MLRVDVVKKLGEFSLEATFESEGRVTGLFGASGAGKTSLVNMIAGLTKPDRGTIAIDGEIVDDTAKGVHIPTWRRRIGYVFQDARLFPHLDVTQNLDYGRRMNGLPDDAEQKKRVTDLLDIGHLLDRRPGKLSGGERQRVALGRALLAKRLRDEARIPMVYVSHDAAEMRQLATQIVLLQRGRVSSFGGVKVLS
jgi:molybdate transport system ATP-binding protein